MDIPSLLNSLGYSSSNGNWITLDNADPRLSHQLRLAGKAKVIGCYVYHTSLNDEVTPPQPAVYVASADDENEAKLIQKRLFCLGGCPFLIIVLPGTVRAYTCFRYDAASPESARIDGQDTGTLLDDSGELQFFRSEEIDSGRIWERLAKYLSSETRVDHRLLNNLRQLSSLLRANYAMSRETAHALIGKYIYFHYLRDRKILDENWLYEHHIQEADVFGRNATADGFKALADALQSQFNGDTFPVPTADNGWQTNGALSFVARIFMGDTFVLTGFARATRDSILASSSDQAVTPMRSREQIAVQLALDFQAYDFSFIPIELLSSIYEQFLNDKESDLPPRRRNDPAGRRGGDGVVYTPEPLADYVLSEIETVRPLKTGFRILDPCCGSGVFLVLAYRRLIELKWREQGQCPTPPTLNQILTENIFGVEKDREACHITAFSLLLTLLSYLDAPELQDSKDFQFPTLVDHNIFHADFFDANCSVFTSGLCFDWIAGNPPWSGAQAVSQAPALAWINKEKLKGKAERKVGGNRLDEAFTWRVGDLLNDGGCAGLLVMATTLINSESSGYRKGFFARHDVRRITNFSNLRRILFMGTEGARTEAPAACLVYTKSRTGHRKPILHFGPFVANQIATRSRGGRRRVWTITTYENEIQEIDYLDAVADTPCLWKTALWGNFLDRRTLQRLGRLLSSTLGDVINNHKLLMADGPQLRTVFGTIPPRISEEPKLQGKSEVNMKALNLANTKFHVPTETLALIPRERQFIRSGREAINLLYAPHLLINATLAIFSDKEFVIPDPQLGISGSSEDAGLLKAIALYLNSSVAKYQLFFISAPWGSTVSKINPKELRRLPFPALETQQIQQLAALYDGFAERETRVLSTFSPMSLPLSDVQGDVDKSVEAVLNIPEHISMVAREFMDVRYQLLEGKSGDEAANSPSPARLTEYAEQLRLQVDDFAQRCHHVSIHVGTDAILATVELTQESQTVPVSVSQSTSAAQAIFRAAETQHSQWVYVQRSVRIFDGPRVHIIKAARLLDWTRTQAILDAGDIIAEVLDKTSAHD